MRKGFYCTLCDQSNHEFINLENMSLSYSPEFCKVVIADNIELWNYQYTILLNKALILDEIIYILGHQRLIQEEKVRAILFQYKHWVRDCKNEKGEGRAKSSQCQNLCREFNLNKFTLLFDSQLKFLEGFTNHYTRVKGLLMIPDNHQKLFNERAINLETDQASPDSEVQVQAELISEIRRSEAKEKSFKVFDKASSVQKTLEEEDPFDKLDCFILFEPR